MMTMRVACFLLASLFAEMALCGCVPYNPTVVPVPTTARVVDDIKGYSLPADVMTGAGLIYIVDPPPTLRLPFSGPFWSVFLDGEDDAALIGNLSSGTYIYVYVLPGCHRITTQYSSYELVIDVEEGDIIFLQHVGGGRDKSNLIQIDGVMGRYYLKHSKPGDLVMPVDH